MTFPAYPEVLPLACTATKRPNGDIRMAVAMQKLESAESDRMRAGDPEVANSPDSAAQNVIPMYELKWSHAEKTIARRAFDLALGKELEALLHGVSTIVLWLLRNDMQKPTQAAGIYRCKIAGRFIKQQQEEARSDRLIGLFSLLASLLYCRPRPSSL